MKITIKSLRRDRLNGPQKTDKQSVTFTESEQLAASEGDGFAAEEAKQLSSGKSASELAEVAAKNEHDRDQRFKEHFEIISLVAMWVLAAGMMIAALIWFYHLVSPPTWSRLCPAQVDDIQALLTGGLIVGILANHFKKRIG